MAKNYIDNLSEEVKKGMYEKYRQRHFQHRAPYGYINNKVTRLVEINHEEAPLIRRAYQLYARENLSLSQVQDRLLEEGYSFKSGNARIQKGTLEKILKSVFYSGDFMIKGTFYPGKHDPIVSLDLYQQVQRAFQRGNRTKKVKNDFAFSGLITWHRGGCAVTAQIQRERYVYYHCTNHRGKCYHRYIREESIAEQFGSALKRLEIDENTVAWIKDGLKLHHAQELEYHNERVKSLQAQYWTIESRINRIYDDRLDDKIDEATWLQKTQQYRAEHRMP